MYTANHSSMELIKAHTRTHAQSHIRTQRGRERERDRERERERERELGSREERNLNEVGLC